MIKKKSTKPTWQMIQHQRYVTSAAYTYHNIDWMSLGRLAKEFGVSQNTIADWLCEAVEKRLVPADDVCRKIMLKHIREYERTHRISGSCLIGKYNAAFRARANVPVTTEYPAIA